MCFYGYFEHFLTLPPYAPHRKMQPKRVKDGGKVTLIMDLCDFRGWFGDISTNSQREGILKTYN